MPPEPVLIQYLNTDLDLVCDIEPRQLTTELEAQGLGVVVTPGEDGNWYVLCEDANDDEPEPNLIRLLDAIESLSNGAAQQ